MKEIAEALRVIYLPLMWACVAFYAALGALGILRPESLRGAVRRLAKPAPIRLIGIVLVLVGAETFVHARITSLPWLIKTLGVVLFVGGGVRVVVPMLSVIVAERMLEVSRQWYRLAGLLSLGIAYLFYLATRLPAIP